MQPAIDTLDTPKKKAKPQKYPCGFTFWEDHEYAAAIANAAEENGGTVSNWLRATIRKALRKDGWIAKPSLRKNGNGNA